MDQNTHNPQTQQPQQAQTDRPNDSGAFVIEGFLKITDPDTNEIIVEKRA